MKTLLKSISLLLCVITVLLSLPATSSAAAVEDKAPFDVDALSALLMDSATGEVLYAKNAAEALPPASVTKIMTLLLVMEAIDSGQLSLEDKVQVSEYAASMGGSQVYLEPGEEMKCEDLLKSVIIASANGGHSCGARVGQRAGVCRPHEREGEGARHGVEQL